MKLFLVFILGSLSFLALADTKEYELVSVTGSCKKDISPDRVSISVSIEELNKAQRVSSENANLKYNALLKKVKSMKLKHAEYATTEYRVFPYKVYENRKHVMKGYKTKITLKISTSEIKKTGKLLSIGNDFGQDYVQGPNPYVSDSLYKKTYLACLKVAMRNAKNKASIIVSNSDRKLGNLFSVYEGQGRTTHAPRPMYKSMRMEGVSASNSAPPPANIEFGKNKINVNLSVAYKLK